MSCNPIELYLDYERIWKDLSRQEKDHLIEKSVDQLDLFRKESYNEFMTDCNLYHLKKSYLAHDHKEAGQIIRAFNWDEVILKLIIKFNDMVFNENLTDYTKYKSILKMLIKKISEDNKTNFISSCVSPNLQEGIKIEKFFMNLMVKHLHDLYIQKNINELINLEKTNEIKKSSKNKNKNKNKKRIRNKKKNTKSQIPDSNIDTNQTPIGTSQDKITSLSKLKNDRAESACKKISQILENKKNCIMNQINQSVYEIAKENDNQTLEDGSAHLYQTVKTTGLEDFWEDSKKISFEADSFFDVKTQKQSDQEKLSKGGDFFSFGQRSYSGTTKTVFKSDYKSEKSKIKSFHQNIQTKNSSIKIFNSKIEEKESEEIPINDPKNNKNENCSNFQNKKKRKCKSLKKMKKSTEYIINDTKDEHQDQNSKSKNYKIKLKKSKKNKYTKKQISKLPEQIPSLEKSKSPINSIKKKVSEKKDNIIKKWAEEKPKKNQKNKKKEKKIPKSDQTKKTQVNKKDQMTLSQIGSHDPSQPKRVISKWGEDTSQPIIFNNKKKKKKLKLAKPFTLNSFSSNFFNRIKPNLHPKSHHTFNDINPSNYPYYFQNNAPIPSIDNHQYSSSIFSQMVPNSFDISPPTQHPPINKPTPFYFNPKNPQSKPQSKTNSHTQDYPQIKTQNNSNKVMTKQNDTDSTQINKSETDKKNTNMSKIEQLILNKKSEIINLNQEAFYQFTGKSVKKIIDDVQNQTNPINNHRAIILKRINKIVHKSFKTDQVNVISYGSYETGLLTPESDLDLAITFSTFTSISNEDKLYFLETLANNLKLFEFVLKTEKILTATVPVIKVEANASIEFKDFPEKANESKVIKVDIIVGSHESNGDINTAFKTTNFIKHAIQIYPSFFEVNLFFKYILTTHNLANAFNGGFNSYGLSIFIIAFLHSFNYTQSTDLGRIVFEFLNFFANIFLPHSTIVDLQYCKLRSHQPFIKCEPFITGGQLYITDPTSVIQKNVTASCLRIYQIQSFFGQCYQRIFSVQQFMKIKLLKKLEETLNKGVSSENRVFFAQEANNFTMNEQNLNENDYGYDHSLQHTMNNSLKLSNFEKNLNFSNKINNPKQNQIEILSQDNHKKTNPKTYKKDTTKKTLESIPSTRGPTKSLVIKPKHNFQDLNPSCDLISNNKIDNQSENILSNDNDLEFDKKKIKNEKIQEKNLETFILNKEDLIKSFEDVYPDLYEIVFSLNGHLIDQQSGCESVVHDKLQSDLDFNAQGNYIN